MQISCSEVIVVRAQLEFHDLVRDDGVFFRKVTFFIAYLEAIRRQKSDLEWNRLP
jgi:hypothetical protein